MIYKYLTSSALGFLFAVTSASADVGELLTHGEEWEGNDGDKTFVEPFGENQNWNAIVLEFGGQLRTPSSYKADANGFRQFMIDSGVTEYDPIDIITPPSPDIAKKCGVKYLLPARSEWTKGAAITLWAESIALVAGEKPTILNWYRTPCYNKAVGGVSGSDHISARSADLDFQYDTSRRRAQNWLCKYWKSSLNMQIGLGASVIHLGAQSPRGKRNWFYPSYQDGDIGKTCFD